MNTQSREEFLDFNNKKLRKGKPLSPYRISLINCETEETRTNNDLIVVRGVVTEANEYGNFDGNSSSEEDEQVTNNWSKEMVILQNSTTLIPFRSVGKSFTFVTTLSPGTNTIDFVSKDGKNTNYKQLVYKYERPELSDAPVRSIIPMLILCRDEEQPEDLIESTSELIRLGMKICQAFFEEKLFEHGFDKRSFHVSSKVKVLKLDSLTMNEVSKTSAEKIWEKLACQIKASEDLWNPLHKYVAFLFESCRLVTVSLLPKNACRLACGAGGLALIGFNSFPTWPKKPHSILDAVFSTMELRANPLMDMTMYLGHLKNTAGALYCATMGAVAHEIGHIFDLGHSGGGLMGTDYVRFEQFFTPVSQLKIDCIGCILSMGFEGRRSSRGEQYVKEIVITLSHSSAKIIANHRWFVGAHDLSNSDKCPTLVRNKIVSCHPLDVVEIRHIDNGMVLRHFVEFTDNPYEFVLSKRDIPIEVGDVGVIFAQDCKGSFLKLTISRSDLPNLFTPLR